MSHNGVNRRLVALGAAAIVGAIAPLVAAPVLASQQGDDHKVTICHRTHSDRNPYVEITIDKAAVFKRGHDTHDEGGVWKPGLKAAGQWWGDIIPPFDYYASPKDQESNTVSSYPGLNWSAEGQSVYNNGCRPPVQPPVQEGPSGEITGRCEPETGEFFVEGTFDNGDAESVQWRLSLSSGSPIALSTSPFDVKISAVAGTTVTLQYSEKGGAWADAGTAVTVRDCSQFRGSFTTVCTPTGANVTMGTLSTGPSWVLTVGSTDQSVSSGSVVAVAGGASLALVAVSGGTRTTVQSGTAPAACPQQANLTITRALEVTKTVDQTVAPVGDTLSYALTVKATGAVQTDVTVTDPIPAGTSYVLGSVSCDGGCAGTPTVTGGVITWPLGTMNPGDTRTVRFRVTIDQPAEGEDGSVPAVTIRNSGAVSSAEVGRTPSNEVVTEVPAVLGVKEGRSAGQPPQQQPTEVRRTLARTGVELPLGAQALIAAMLIGLGAGLLRWSARPSRR